VLQITGVGSSGGPNNPKSNPRQPNSGDIAMAVPAFFTRLTLARRLGLGFGSLLLMLLVVAGLSVVELRWRASTACRSRPAPSRC
jgi:hypothetical protein